MVRRTTVFQKELLLSMLEKAPNLGVSGVRSEEWSSIADVLNGQHGPVKVPERWRRTWYSIKADVRNKYKMFKEGKIEHMTKYDKRVVNFIAPAIYAETEEDYDPHKKYPVPFPSVAFPAIQDDELASCTPIITDEQKEKLLSIMEKQSKKTKWTKIASRLNNIGPKRHSTEWKEIWFEIQVDTFDKYCKYKMNNTELEGKTTPLSKNTNVQLSSYEKRVINLIESDRRPFDMVEVDSSSDESKKEIVDAIKKPKKRKRKKHQKEKDVTITKSEEPIKTKMMKLVEDHFETIEKSKHVSTKYYARNLRRSEKKLQELEKRTKAEEESYVKEMEYMNRKMDYLNSSVI